MPSNYPAALDNLPASFAGTDQADVVDHAGMHNTERDAINAMQAELGTDPSGAAATVKARLEAIEANDWVTGARIAANAVGTSEIADGTVTLRKTLGAYQAPSTNVTLTAEDGVVAVDTTAGARTLTLPAASAMTGRALRIIKTGGASPLTVSRAGSDTISPSNGSRTSVAFPSDCAMGELLIVSSGTGWHVVSGQASDATAGSRLYKWSQATAATSTTATVGWSLVYFDSGWRMLWTWNGSSVTYQDAGLAMTNLVGRPSVSGLILLNRSGTTVSLIARSVKLSTGAVVGLLWDTGKELPAGWRPKDYLTLPWSRTQDLSFSSDTSKPYFYSPTAGDTLAQTEKSWQAISEALPTSLPGTAA